MKRCPHCQSLLFDDMDTCLNCISVGDVRSGLFLSTPEKTQIPLKKRTHSRECACSDKSSLSHSDMGNSCQQSYLVELVQLRKEVGALRETLARILEEQEKESKGKLPSTKRMLTQEEMVPQDALDLSQKDCFPCSVRCVLPQQLGAGLGRIKPAPRCTQLKH